MFLMIRNMSVSLIVQINPYISLQISSHLLVRMHCHFTGSFYLYSRYSSTCGIFNAIMFSTALYQHDTKAMWRSDSNETLATQLHPLRIKNSITNLPGVTVVIFIPTPSAAGYEMGCVEEETKARQSTHLPQQKVPCNGLSWSACRAIHK